MNFLMRLSTEIYLNWLDYCEKNGVDLVFCNYHSGFTLVRTDDGNIGLEIRCRLPEHINANTFIENFNTDNSGIQVTVAYR